MTKLENSKTIPEEWKNVIGEFVTRSERIEIKTEADLQYIKYRLDRLRDLFQNPIYILNSLYLECYCTTHRRLWSKLLK